MSDKLRVAQVLAGAENGGAENFFVRLSVALQASGQIDERAFIRRHGHRLDALRSQGVDAEGFRFGGGLDFYDSWVYRRRLNNFNPDVVMTWMGRASAATPKGDYVLVNRLGHYYKLKYYQQADYWVGISKGICRHLIEGGMPEDRVVHIPNFADEAPVEPLPRDSFNTPADVPLLLAAGRLHVNKGFDTLLRALVDVPDAFLWLAGSGPEEQSLKSLCTELGLDQRVRFLGWRTDVTALMRSVDAFVCPSRHEGLGSIVMESFAHRCPIIATRSQGPGEVIENEKTGLLTDIDDVGQLTEAIKRTLGNEALRQQWVDNASDVYASTYSREVIVSSYLGFYNRIHCER
ncbi:MULTISPECIES: glycosyltransferase [Spongiibacter]|uniref:glycosyltransferase n=1 Tax=Spongiibacter TaxID=630749 RepID=UPI001B2BDE3A|nr:MULTISPECIES: glycosyltransferase [Spongiibacter]MBO6753630.1 glycosyltransferase [Spongiibacter sp.]|tara:strand:+ start:6704 stop:7747 length:1044 start_codon:yes stop_codon:yes gene_type:complete